MKRTQKCFDLQNLEIDTKMHRESKRYRLDSDQSDYFGDTDLSDISEDFEKSAVITPTAAATAASSAASKLSSSVAVSLDMIQCKFEFVREDYQFGSNIVTPRSQLGNSFRKRGVESQ